MSETPFERFDLEVSIRLDALTRLLRERIEDAESEAERASLREAWELLSRDFATRARLAMETLPKDGPSLPPAPNAKAPDPEVEEGSVLPALPRAFLALERAALTQEKTQRLGQVDAEHDGHLAFLEHVRLP